MKTEVTIIRKEVLKKLVACLLLFQLIIACETNKPTEVVEKPLPKIAIAGLAIESSTFSPALTHIEAFHAVRGVEIFNYNNEVCKQLMKDFMEDKPKLWNEDIGE